LKNRLLEKFGYAYDAAGNLLYRTNDTLIHTFSGNALNQISNITRNGTMTVAGSTAIPVTNVTVNTSNSILYADLTFASTNHSLVDGTNVYTAVAWDSSGQTDTNTISAYLPATVSMTHDTNGNLTFDGRKSFEYDDENQLIRVTVTNAWKSEFVYDGKMRRRVRTEFVWSGAAWVTNEVVRYIYDGNLAIQERDGSNAPVRTVARGRDLSGSMQGAGGIGGMLSLTVHGAINTNAYYHADGNGNITALVGTNQTLVAKYLYDPYGNTMAMSGDLAETNSYRFSSKEHHANSGMYYYLYRYYVPEVQRWLTEDPIQEQGGMNLYAFIVNNGINLLDPFGLSCFSDCMDKQLGNAQLFAQFLGAYGVGALGNIPCNGKPLASIISRTAFYNGTRGSLPPFLRMQAGIQIGQNASNAARAAAVVGAFMAGYAAGSAVYCANECPGSGGSVGPFGRPPIHRNAPPDMIIRGI
jgi:RHS repeat-associated protein